MKKYDTLLVCEDAGENITGENPDAIADFCRERLKMDKSPQESVYVIFLDTKNNITGYEMISKGSICSSSSEPRDVFRSAILTNASCIVLAHNHPSGDCTPSDADRRVTEQIIKAGKIMNIPLIDHIIIGRPCYYSFKIASSLFGN